MKNLSEAIIISVFTICITTFLIKIVTLSHAENMAKFRLQNNLYEQNEPAKDK